MGWNKQTVRPNPVAKIPTVLCVLVFLLSAAAVHLVARIHFDGNPKVPYTATAWLTERPATAAVAAGTTQNHQSPVSAIDLDPLRAVEIANSLADRQANQRHAEWRNNAEQLLQQARQSAEHTAREYRQRLADLEMYQRQVRGEGRIAPSAPAAVAPKMLENPERKALEQQIAELRQRAAQLLVGRTEAHPAVQEMAAKIADLESQLAGLPATIPSPNTDLASDPALKQLTEDHPQIDNQKMAELASAVEASRRASEAADAALAQANQHSQAEPQLLVKYAEVPPATVKKTLWNHLNLLATIFATAVMMSFGVGLTWIGVHTRPPVHSVEQLEADLLVPVVGVVPSDAPDSGDVAGNMHRRNLTLGLGLTLSIACPIVAVWVVLSL